MNSLYLSSYQGMAGMQGTQRKEWIGLSLVCLMALFLLFFRLGERSLWEDEARVVFKSGWDFGDLALFQKNLVFNSIVSTWSQLGKTEFWLRTPSALFAFFSLLVCYELGKKFLSSPLSLLATFLLGTSPFFLFESRQVKAYSLAILFSLLSIHFLIRFLETGQRGDLVSHLGAVFIALLTHYMFLGLYSAQLIFVCGHWKQNPRRVREYFVALFLASLPSFLIILGLLGHLNILAELYFHPKAPEPFSFPLGYFGKMAFVYYLFAVGPTVFPWKILWVLPGCLLPLLLLLYSLKSFSRPHFTLLILAFMGPIFLLAALRNAQPHHTLLSLPFYIFLVVTGLSHFGPFLKRLLLVGLLVMNAYGLTNYFLGRQYLFITHLEPYREITQWVIAHFQKGDLLLHSQRNLAFQYYFTLLYENGGPARRLHATDKNGMIHLKTWEELEQRFPSHTRRIWFIERSPGQFIDGQTPIPDVEKFYRETVAFRTLLDSRFRRLGRWTFLEDPDVEKKKRFLRKFYVKDRIVVSLYDLKAPL